VKILAHFGTFLAIIGSLLPWEQGGDFLPYWIYGIRLYPYIHDYGGAIVILLALTISMLTSRPPKWVGNPKLLTLFISVFLAGSAVFFVGRWAFHRVEAAGIIGAPVIQIGLIVVVSGSALLLLSAIIDYRQKQKSPTVGVA
jgi:hypothetical protein